jgi:hypothetical protein
LEPQPPSPVKLSTGTERAGRDSGATCDEGVDKPGVDGGVKAGETRPGRIDSESAFGWEEAREETFWEWFSIPRLFRSSSDICRETGIGCGEKNGGGSLGTSSCCSSASCAAGCGEASCEEG